jgi:hypothetical protein
MYACAKKREKNECQDQQQQQQSRQKKRDVRREENEKAIMYTNKYKTLVCIERERKEKKRKEKLLFVFGCVFMIEILCLFEGKVYEYDHHPKTGK